MGKNLSNRRWMSFLAFFLLSLLVAGQSTLPTFPLAGGKLAGDVVDGQGNPVGNLVLRFIPVGDKGGSVLKLKVDKNGRFSHSFFPSGSYKIELEGDGFLKSISVASFRDGRENYRDRSDAHPEAGLPPIRLTVSEKLEIHLVWANGAEKQQIARSFQLFEASGPLKKAQDLVGQGDLQGALQAIDDLIGKMPGVGQAYYLRGVVLSRLDQFDESLAAFKKCQELTPDQPSLQDAIGTVLIQKGQALEQAGKKEDAKSQFVEALRAINEELKANPGNAGVLQKKALCLERMGNSPELRQVLRDLLSADPNNAEVKRRLAVLEVQAGNIESAQGLANLDPADRRNAPIFFNMAVKPFNDGKFDEAIALAQKAIQADPSLVAGHKLLANAFLAKGDIPNAIVHLQKIIELAPNDPDTQVARDTLKALQKGR